mgnify:CR=1 FL=1
MVIVWTEEEREKFKFVSSYITQLSRSFSVVTQLIDAVFKTYPLLYHKFENMVVVRPENLYSLYSPGNQDYQKIIHFNFFIKKG